MKIILLGLVVGSAISPSPAFADAYRYIAKDFDGAAIFLDESSIVRDGDVVGYWSVEIEGDYLAGKPSRIAFYTLRHSVNCSTRVARPTNMSIYDVDGKRTVSDDNGGKEGPIEPGTIDQTEFEAACMGVPAKPGTTTDADSPFALAKMFRSAVMEAQQ